MARLWVGGTAEDWVSQSYKFGPRTLLAAGGPDVEVALYDAYTDEQLTDLLDVDGNPVTVASTTDALGHWGPVQLPDGVLSARVGPARTLVLGRNENASLSGPQGPEGPAGPGASDEDVAGYVEGDGPTKAALEASFAHGVIDITAPGYGAVGDNSTDCTAAIQTAVDDATSTGAAILVPTGTFVVSSEIGVSDGLRLRGSGFGGSIIKSTHAGSVFTNTDPDVVQLYWQFTDLRFDGPGSGVAGSCAIDLNNVSLSVVENVRIRAFDRGVRVRSVDGAGGRYNKYFGAQITGCTRGVSIEGPTTNANQFIGCRLGGNDTGVRIEDSTQVGFSLGEIEGSTIGFHVTHSGGTQRCEQNLLLGARLEGNTTAWQVDSGVFDTHVNTPHPIGPYVVVDNGTRTRHIGSNTIIANYEHAHTASADGSFRWERTLSGGNRFPLALFRDSVTNAGVPVTIQAETERDGGFFFRGKRGGTTYYDVRADGVVFTGSGPTAMRPDPATSTGGQWYDTDLKKPIWSDGSDWMDATGTAV